MTEAEKLRQFNKERSERNIRAGRTAEGIATGDVEAFVPDIKVDTLTDESGNVPESTIADSVQMAQKGMSPQEIAASQAQKVDTMSATKAAKPADRTEATYDATQIKKPAVVNAASGELSPEAVASVEEIRNLSGPAEAARVSKALVDSAKADTVEGVLSAGAFSPNVTGIGGQLASTPQAEKEQREAIVGDAAMGSAAEILNTVNYEAAQQRVVKGTAAKGAAANMVAQTAAIPEPIAAAIVEDPASVEAQVDNEPVEVQAAIAALPSEALVSSQMETLLAGIEDGDVPIWAKAAVDSVNTNLAQRGMNVSTVGRDALFNAIIQTSLPIAQALSLIHI